MNRIFFLIKINKIKLKNYYNLKKIVFKSNVFLKNLISLSALQVANYLLPLITVPYIVRIISPTDFGLINFALAFITYFMLIINYGFDLSATREISVNRSNNIKLSTIFWEVFFTKAFLFFFSAIIFFILLFFVNVLRNNKSAFILTFISLVGSVLFPTWLYLGLEKMTISSLINFIIKLIFTLFIFVFISKPSEYLLVIIFSTLGQIISGVWGLIYAINKYRIKFLLPTYYNILKLLRSNFAVFTSTIAINIYTATSTVILGFVAPVINVGYYTVALKIILAVQNLVIFPFNQAFYPNVGFAFGISTGHGIKKLKKAFVIMGIISFLVSIFILLLSKKIILIIFGTSYYQSIIILKIMSFLPFIIVCSNILGIHGLLNLKKDKEFFFVTLIGAIISVVLNLILVPIFYQLGSAVSLLISEIFIAIMFFLILQRGKFF